METFRDIATHVVEKWNHSCDFMEVNKQFKVELEITDFFQDIHKMDLFSAEIIRIDNSRSLVKVEIVLSDTESTHEAEKEDLFRRLLIELSIFGINDMISKFGI